jgi:hypothetical protein
MKKIWSKTRRHEMNKKIRTIIPAMLLVLAVSVAGSPFGGSAQASGMGRSSAAPLAPLGSAFTYQGRLTLGGNPANGSYDFQFKLFNASVGGTQVGTTQTAAGVGVSNGLFTVTLDFGQQFMGEAFWLELSVRPANTGGYTTLSPRQALTAAPYAMGLMPGTIVYNSSASANFSSVNAGSGAGLIGNSGSGYGVYGVSNAAAGRGVYGESANGRGVMGFSQTGNGVRAESPAGYGIYALSTTGNGAVAESVSGIGVLGASSTSMGVLGQHTANTGTQAGVMGETNSTAGGTVGAGAVGVYGRVNPTNAGGYSAGVHGHNNSTGTGVGVLGTHGGTSAGVWGESVSGSGVVGWVTGSSGLNYGVYGYSPSPTGYGGYFSGRVHVAGTLSKSAGSFKIDHPQDPANKYLSHSFVESPDMMNVYNGNVTTDAKGEAVVQLPTYFEALNKDFRYQLTVIGQFAQAIVSEEIRGNRFTIRTDKPNVKVSWQVTGIRHDRYAEQHRIPVEEDKPANERGKYLDPGLYGKPDDLRLNKVEQKSK